MLMKDCLLWEPSTVHNGQFQIFNASDSVRHASLLHRWHVVVDTSEKVHGFL